MKRVMIFLGLLMPLFGFAQGLYFTQDAAIFIEDGGELPYLDIYFVNAGTEEVEVALKLERICYVDGDNSNVVAYLENFHLFPTNQTSTWGDLSSSNPLFTLAAGDSTIFALVHFSGMHGSTWDWIFFDRNNPTNADTLHILIGQDECLVSSPIVNDKEKSVKLYPNPVTDQCVIEYEGIDNMDLVILNSIAQIVQVIPLDFFNQVAAIDLSGLAEGLYFYYLHGDDKRTEVESFIKGK